MCEHFSRILWTLCAQCLVLLCVQESAGHHADGNEVGDATRVEADTAVATHNSESAAQSKEIRVPFNASRVYGIVSSGLRLAIQEF